MQIVLVLLISLMGAILNITLAPALKLFGCAPDLMLAIVLAIALHYGAFMGAMAGLVGGLVLDAFLGPYFGLYASLHLIGGFLTGWIAKRNQNALERVMLTAVSSAIIYAVKQLIGLLSIYVRGVQISLPMAYFSRLLPGTMLAVAVSVPICLLLGLLFQHPFMQPRWRNDIFRQDF